MVNGSGGRGEEKDRVGEREGEDWLPSGVFWPDEVRIRNVGTWDILYPPRGAGSSGWVEEGALGEQGGAGGRRSGRRNPRGEAG